MMKNSIRNWLVVPFIGFFLLPLLALGGILSLQNYLIEKERIKLEQQEITVFASEKISSFLREQRDILKSLLKTNYLPEMKSEQKKGILSLFQAAVKDDNNLPVFNKLSLLDERGRVIALIARKKLVLGKDLLDLSASDAFRIPTTKKDIYYSPVYFDKETVEPYIALSLPIEDLRTQAVREVLLAEINLKSTWQTIATMKIGKHGTAFITSSDGKVIAHKNRSVVLRRTFFPPPAEPTVMKGISGAKSLITTNKIELAGQTLVFVTEVPTSEAFRHINMIILLIGVFFLCFLLGGLLIGFVVIRQIVKPIETLADTARSISAGNFAQTTEVTRKDELGELAMAFNTMISKLFSTITKLEYEKNFVRNVIESLTHPFYVIDINDYTVKLANSAANFDPHADLPTCYKLTHNSNTPCEGDQHPCPIQEILKTKQPVTMEHVHQLADGNKHIIEIYGYPVFDKDGEVIQIIEYSFDVTEKKNLEQQLQQSQKLEAVGTLTGGVAHDFNNLLTTILGYSQLVLMDKKENDPEREHIDSIFEAAEKASELVRQLLAFSRKQLMDIKVINLNNLVTNISKMLNRLIGENIEIQMFLNKEIGNIKADPGQVEQVIVNLVINARDAMSSGGKIYLESDSVELDEEYCKSHAKISPGFYVVFSVTDTGVGMPPEVKEKIFDPFYTTKKAGEGTGLGLATVYGIVKQMQGHIYVYSELNRGTTFKIYFPEVYEKVDKIKKEKAVLVPGTETIFVVDDEPSILRLVTDTLHPLGYKVITASSAENALEILENIAEEIDLLLTDVIMQNMNGRELAEAMEPMQPNMKVLFMSGYTDNVIAQKGIIKEGVNFIPKPIFPTMLSSKIRALLDEDN